MRLPAGAAGICGTAALASLAAFASGTPPPTRDCIASASSGPGRHASVIILVEDLEGGGAQNQLLLDATNTAVSHLSPQDSIGFAGNTDKAELPVPLQPVGDRRAVSDAVRSVQDISDPDSYDPAVKAAAAALAGETGVKEVILIGDGDAKPVDPATLNLLRGQGATVSTIYEQAAANDKPDQMQQLARDGGGTYQSAGAAANTPDVLSKAVC
ncbi:MAG TPA: hypothetical protein VG329_04330 [Candidatus Dormibacteraeota bacterium]|jgi:hypothetical protein|nr:hypothetical protein [Candidatus Dormibacteraeota bacterium]